MSAKWTVLSVGVLGLLAACAVKEAPPTADLVEDALPSTTKVAAEWTAPAGDTGTVDDGWLKNFHDPQLDALVKEALNGLEANASTDLFLARGRVDRLTQHVREFSAAPLKTDRIEVGNVITNDLQGLTCGRDSTGSREHSACDRHG